MSALTLRRTAPSSASHCRSRHRDDSEPVLMPSVTRHRSKLQLSKFGDDVWDLSPALDRENAPRWVSIIRFLDIVDPRERLTLKEYLWARLNGPPFAGAHRARLAPAKAYDTLGNLLRFTRFVREHRTRFKMRSVDQPLLDAYLASLKSVVGRSSNTILILVNIAIDLHRHAGRLTLGGFACRPWSGRAAHRIAGCVYRPADRGNRTARIPEAMIAALLKRAFSTLRFIRQIYLPRGQSLRSCDAVRWHRQPSSIDGSQLIFPIGLTAVAVSLKSPGPARWCLVLLIPRRVLRSRQLTLR